MSVVETNIEVGNRLEAGLASAAGALNLGHAEMTRVVAEAIETDSWGGTSVEQWVEYQAGVTYSRAKQIVAVAQARERFPVVVGRFDAGELSLEQVYELSKAPPVADADLEDWGLVATPARIRRSIKRRYGGSTGDTDSDAADAAADTSADDSSIDGGEDGDRAGDAGASSNDWVSSGVTDEHRWRFRGEFDLESAALIDAALMRARERLWERGQREITEADCWREVAQGYLDQVESPLQRDRSKVWIHIEADTGLAVDPTGVRVPDAVAAKISCDGLIQPVWERDGVPFNLGRTQHIVPERTRRIVVLRDTGCRVPGCSHDRFVEIHHIIHWSDGGATDTWNLVALCPKHHRMHHHGRLGISGNADEPDGLVFTDGRGRRLAPCGAPTPPTEIPRPVNGYRPPVMGRVDWDWVGIGWPDPPDPEPSA